MTMKLTLAAMAAAMAMAVAGVAQAAVDRASAPGNSSVLFVALDQNSNAGLVVDLGLNMSDFTNVESNLANLPHGQWNFTSSTFTASGSYAKSINGDWSAGFNLFKGAQAGNDYTWAVVAGDQITGAAASATNPIIGRGVLATGEPSETTMRGITLGTQLGNAIGNFNNFLTAATNRGNLLAAENGSAFTNASMGDAWLPTLMGSNFNGTIPWSYMSPDDGVTRVNWFQQVVSNPVVRQLGNPFSTDTLATNPLTFQFDIDTGTLTVAPIPEPGTYAMLIAGLAALGFVARRRKA